VLPGGTSLPPVVLLLVLADVSPDVVPVVPAVLSTPVVGGVIVVLALDVPAVLAVVDPALISLSVVLSPPLPG